MNSSDLYRLAVSLEKKNNPLGKLLKEYANDWAAQVIDLRTKNKKKPKDE